MEEEKMIFNVIGIIIGLAVLVAGIFYLVKEKNDKESVKIYSTVSIIGGLIFIFVLLKSIFSAL